MTLSDEEKRAKRAEYMRAYYQANREKKAEYFRAYNKANREKVNAKSRAWGKANPEKKAAYTRAYYQANSEKANASKRAWREAHPEEARAKDRAYREANHEKILAAATVKRRAAGMQPQVVLSPEEKKARRLARGTVSTRTRYQVLSVGRCRNCGWSVADGARLHVDHVVPVSKGGASDISNLQALCAPCNLGKSDHYEAV